MDFSPIILPLDNPPPEAESYKNCEICTEKSPIIWGEGNPKAPIIIVLDNPGKRIDKEGNEYVCGTRQTLQSAVFHANFTLNDIYVTYLLKCSPIKKYNKDEVRAFSKPFLIKQIKASSAKYLVFLGDTVIKSLYSENTDVKSLRGTWQKYLGLPVMVSYHPLAVRRRPNLLNIFMKDWIMLANRYFHDII